PIVGCSLDVDFGDNRDAQPSAIRALSNEPRSKPAGKIALLAMTADGFANLMRLSKSLYFEPSPDEPTHVKIARIEEFSEGIIALTGGPQGPIDTALRDGQHVLAVERLKTL